MGQKAEVMDGCLKKVKKEQVRHLNLGSMQRLGVERGTGSYDQDKCPFLVRKQRWAAPTLRDQKLGNIGEMRL